jgi:hypothetical protein
MGKCHRGVVFFVAAKSDRKEGESSGSKRAKVE